jgi:hypothetical protein
LEILADLSTVVGGLFIAGDVAILPALFGG